MCWSPARANSAAGVAYGWFCSGVMGCGGIWPNKKLSWREGGIRAWAAAVLMGSWCQGRSRWPRRRRRSSGRPSVGRRAGLLGGMSGDAAVNLVCIASTSSYRIFIVSLTTVQELLCHHKPHCGSRLSDVSHTLQTDVARLQRVTAAPAVMSAITLALEGGCSP